MKKYLWGFVFVLLASVVVTSQYEDYATNSTAPCENSCSSAVATGNSPQPKGNSQQPQPYPPRWLVVLYELFGWPNGITVWALFLTMMVIAEQTSQTRRAADATKDAADAARKQANHMAATERAWLVLSSITKSGSIIAPGYSPYYWWQVKNLGTTPARLIETQAHCKLGGGQLAEEPTFARGAIELYERILGPGDTLEFFSFWENDDGTIFRDRMESLGSICLRSYGYIKYRTLFSPDICESRFCDYFNHFPDKPIAQQIAATVIDFRPDLTAPANYTKNT